MSAFIFVIGLLLTSQAAVPTGRPPYRVGVVSESGDVVTWLRPVNESLVVDRVVPVGIMPTAIDGPHNIAPAPDGTSYYITIAHGTPYGSLWKLDAAHDSLLGRAQLELFPTTIGLTPDGQFAFVANSDFHGDHPRTNLVSVVHTPTMNKITDLPACDMPHGVKANHAGTRIYISCMHSDEILELDMATLGVVRRAGTGERRCSPTFVSVSPDDARLYVACNAGNSLQVWGAGRLSRTAEIPVGRGAYNVEPTPDGKLVLVTNKQEGSVSLVDAGHLAEVARVSTSKKVVHGIAFSPDSRLAYISSESVGSDPGSVDVIDLAARKLVASIPVPGQPAGIAVLPLPPTSERR